MTDLYLKYRSNIKFLGANIDYLTYDERLELLAFIEYYIDKAVVRKFEHNFNVK